MKTTLPILVLFVLLAPFKASQLNIKLKPLLDIPDEVDNDFAGFLFEPYEPSPSIPRTCYDSCPCGGEVENCGCGLEKVCGGSFPANLSAKDAIGFHYDASSDDTKYISIKGSVGRTRIEFQGLYDCPVSPGIVTLMMRDWILPLRVMSTMLVNPSLFLVNVMDAVSVRSTQDFNLTLRMVFLT